MSDATVEFSVVIPCLDEARTVGQCVAAARDFFDRRGIDGEVVVADNGSSDNSPALAEAAGVRRLLLTHFYPGLDPRDALERASKTYRGPIELARDGLCVEIAPRGAG